MNTVIKLVQCLLVLNIQQEISLWSIDTEECPSETWKEPSIFFTITHKSEGGLAASCGR